MKASPLDMALQQLTGLKSSVMDKRLQAMAARKQGGGQPASPDAQTGDGGEQGPSEEELARLLGQYCAE